MPSRAISSGAVGTFGFLAFWVHVGWRTPEPTTPAWLRERGAWIEGALMTLCIGAGEYGLAILAYLLAWELLLGPGLRREGQTHSLRQLLRVSDRRQPAVHAVRHDVADPGGVAADDRQPRGKRLQRRQRETLEPGRHRQHVGSRKQPRDVPPVSHAADLLAEPESLRLSV
jgi:hypothetical protein